MQPNWQPTTQQENDALAAIQHLTEGIPLAIELVAAGMGDDAYSNVELVAKTLEDTPLPALPEGYISDSSERHESLTRCLDWSYNLLDADAQDGFARLGLFADTFTPETAEHACGVTNGGKLLSRLAQASLIKRVEPRTEIRYTFLRSTRAYAHDKFNARSDADDFRRAYLNYYQKIVIENGGIDFINLRNANKRRVLDSEWRNIAIAVETAGNLQDWFAVQNMTANMVDFFDVRGLWVERIQIGMYAVTAAQADGNKQNEGIAVGNLGCAYGIQNFLEESERCFQHCLIIWKEINDKHAEGITLNNLGNVYQKLNRLVEAEDYCLKSLTIKRCLHDRIGEAFALGSLGIICRLQNRLEEAEQYYKQDLAICIETSNFIKEGSTLLNLGIVYDLQNRAVEAEKCYEQSLSIKHEVGDVIGQGKALWNIAAHYEGQGNNARALHYARQALHVLETTQDVQTTNLVRSWIQKWGKFA